MPPIIIINCIVSFRRQKKKNEKSFPHFWELVGCEFLVSLPWLCIQLIYCVCKCVWFPSLKIHSTCNFDCNLSANIKKKQSRTTAQHRDTHTHVYTKVWVKGLSFFNCCPSHHERRTETEDDRWETKINHQKNKRTPEQIAKQKTSLALYTFFFFFYELPKTSFDKEDRSKYTQKI